MKKDFISIQNLKKEAIDEIFTLTDKLKEDSGKFKSALEGKTLALIFQKPSNRTRVSFEVGMTQLGGHTIYLGPDDIKLGVREATKDVAMVLSRYVDAIVARTYSHQDVAELAKWATVPVINGLSDLFHPCQAMADVYTIREKFGKLKGIKFAFVGDGNNVLHSLLQCCSKVGMDVAIATPRRYEPKKEIVQEAINESKKSGSSIMLYNKADEAVKNADVIYTDVWTSMGQEKEYRKRIRKFRGFQVNSELVAKAKKTCLIMHCLPAHRGGEITDEVLDGPNSVILDQAENRMHVQKAILLLLLKT